jgi:hypothetical protein
MNLSKIELNQIIQSINKKYVAFYESYKFIMNLSNYRFLDKYYNKKEII